MKVFILSFILLLSTLLFSQTATENAEPMEQPEFNFAADWNCYRAADSLVYIEYTIALNRQVLTYKPGDSGYIAEFLVEAEISIEDSVLGRQAWRSRDQVEDLELKTMSMVIPIINAFTVMPGDYFLSLKITDLFGKERSRSFKVPVKASSFRGSLSISDIQCASSITRDQSDNPFVKNGYKVLPNPSSVYGIEMPILYCYFEIYNLAPASEGKDGQYTVSYKINDADGNEVKSFPDQVRKKPGLSSVVINNLNVVTLLSGAYTLKVQVTDMDTKETIEGSRRFYVYREADFANGGAAFQKMEGKTKDGQGSPGLDASRYDTMMEEELDLEFDYTSYLATREERRTWKKLNLEGKREYIKEFWAARDETLGTPINEFKAEYLARVQLANTMYRGTFVDGWKTDRGRILLVYSKPDEIERFPSSSDSREYHIWHYYSLQGGIYFIFADKRNMGDLELVHSNARGELYDPDWRRWITPDY